LNNSRPSWDQYFMGIADLAASRSTCLRRQVGAVIVKEKRILTTGYNGAPRGLEHCLETGCLREKMHVPSGERHELCRAIHAEQNAVVQAATSGVDIKNATIYTTTFPCVLCSKILINSSITRIVCKSGYPDELSRRFLQEARITVELMKEDGTTELIDLNEGMAGGARFVRPKTARSSIPGPFRKGWRSEDDASVFPARSVSQPMSILRSKASPCVKRTIEENRSTV